MNIKYIALLIYAVSAGVSLPAQHTTKAVLHSIEANNTTLKALRSGVEAEKFANKTGIALSDPEVELGYLWGRPEEVGNRTDFRVTQRFDIPGITGMRSRLANEKNELTERQYRLDRMAILLEANSCCVELVYWNALKKELEIRLQHAGLIAAAYKERMERGDISLLEYNKVRLNLSAVQGELSRVEVERNALLSQLKRLNGGTEVSLETAQYDEEELPLNFEVWYIQAAKKNPALAYATQETAVNRKEVSLNKAMNLPKLQAGYQNEKTAGQRYRGVTVGLSIPLWENKNRVKQAHAAVRAAESREADVRQQFYGGLQILYQRAAGLKTVADRYRQILAESNNADLAEKALHAGEISLLDYLVEIGLYYDTVNRTLETERDYRKAFAELSAVEL